MWPLVCRQNSKPAWLVLKAGTRLEEQKRAASWQWITHDYGLIIGWFLSFFSCFFFYFSTVAVIVWVWILFVIYLFIEAHWWVDLLVTEVGSCHKLTASLRKTNEVQLKPIMLNPSCTVIHIYVWLCFVVMM